MNTPLDHTWVTEKPEIGELFPPRENGRDVNKGTFGHAVILAGSRDCIGAPILVAEAATRVGAGLVTLVVPEAIEQVMMSRISPVVLTRKLTQDIKGNYKISVLDEALDLVKNATAVVFGPGIGLGEDIGLFARAFIARCPVSIVIDADALTLLSREPDRGESIIHSRTAPTILTPHPGEMGRLLGIKTEQVQEERESSVNKAVSIYESVVVLKGAHTLIGGQYDKLSANANGNPGMATGGTGDVLSGVIVGLLAQGLAPLSAATVGVFIHGLAGDLAATDQGGFTGLIATDLISYLPRAIAKCQMKVDGSCLPT